MKKLEKKVAKRLLKNITKEKSAAGRRTAVEAYHGFMMTVIDRKSNK